MTENSRDITAGFGDNGRNNQATKNFGLEFQSTRGRQGKREDDSSVRKGQCVYIHIYAYIFLLICYIFFIIILEQQEVTEWLPATLLIISAIEKTGPMPPSES